MGLCATCSASKAGWICSFDSYQEQKKKKKEEGEYAPLILICWIPKVMFIIHESSAQKNKK